MSAWLRQLRELEAAGRDCVRVTVMDVRGSAPREIGACMLVTANDLIGSIGGGRLEYECTRLAAGNLPGRTSGKLIESKDCRGPTRISFALGAAMGQCCGGVVDVLFEPVPATGADWCADAWRLFSARTPAVMATSIAVDGSVSRRLLTEAEIDCAGDPVADAARRILDRSAAALCLKRGDTRTLLEPILDTALTVALFGAGHVGSALVNVLANLDCRVRWIDSRRDIFPDQTPESVTCIESAEPAREVMAMPAGAYYLVMTHSHALDYQICEQILKRDDFAYCGLIGSRSKRRRFEKRMRAQDIPEAQIEKLTCPIGIGGIDGKKPAEIAVAVAAQLLQRRQMRSAQAADGAIAGNVHVLRRL